MGLNSHEHFEDHMDVSNPEGINDVERIENVSEDDEDDMFDQRLNDADEYLGNDMVFESKTKENPQYGEGGGKQYFVRDFGNMKQDGRMIKMDEQRLYYVGTVAENPDKSPEIEKQEVQYSYSVDTRPLSEEEREEWKELDENTCDEQGLPRIMPNIESQIVENRKCPWSDQEDSNGSFFPDAYSNPRDLRAGEIFYQLRPVDAKYDSPYVTDENTIEVCKNENGKVDVTKVLQKLQIKPSGDGEYILTQYIYVPGKTSNKIRE